MNTQEFMRKTMAGEKPVVQLRNGQSVKVLDAPIGGRVKVALDDSITELVLRDLRGMLDMIGIADMIAYSPIVVTDKPSLSVGNFCLTMRQSIVSSDAVRRITDILAPDLDIANFDWRADSLLDRLKRHASLRDVSMPYDVWADVGNIISWSTISAGEYWYDVTDRLKWDAGDFGDSTSCFWGCRRGARDVMREYGGLALRFFSPDWEHGLGRCWVIPQKGRLVMFNAYGRMMPGASTATIRQMGAFLAHVLSCDVCCVDLENNGTTDGLIWINSGSGVILGEYDRSMPDWYDLEIDCDDDTYQCIHCGYDVGEDDVRFTDTGDGPYCGECYDRLFFWCHHCNNEFDRDDAMKIRHYATSYGGRRHLVHSTVCPDCFVSLGGATCCECGEHGSLELDDYIVDIDGEAWCATCAARYVNHCEHCEEYVTCDGQSFRDGAVWLCENCLDNGVTCCEICGTIDRMDMCDCQIAEPNQLAFSYQIAHLVPRD